MLTLAHILGVVHVTTERGELVVEVKASCHRQAGLVRQQGWVGQQICPAIYGKAIFHVIYDVTEAGVDETVDAVVKHHWMQLDAVDRGRVVQRQQLLHQTLVGLLQPLFALQDNELYIRTVVVSREMLVI